MVATGFGLSRLLETSGFTTNTVFGPIRFLAPELIASPVDEEFAPRVTVATDVWAFAMTVIEVCVYVFLAPTVYRKFVSNDL